MWLYTIMLHNTAKNSSVNLPSYPRDNHYSSDVVLYCRLCVDTRPRFGLGSDCTRLPSDEMARCKLFPHITLSVCWADNATGRWARLCYHWWEPSSRHCSVSQLCTQMYRDKDLTCMAMNVATLKNWWPHDLGLHYA